MGLPYWLDGVVSPDWFEDRPGLLEFTVSYVEAMYFTDGQGIDNDEFGPDDELSETCVRDVLADCRAFYTQAACYIWAEKEVQQHAAQAGHDFWMTRNGHGVGFWDGDWPVYGDKLTALSGGFPELYPYSTPDGVIFS